MPKKLFVGSLDWETTDDVLKQGFENFGQVISATVVTDRKTGRSRGYGFVTFDDDNIADKAMEAMDGEQFDGRKIVVDVAHNQPGEDDEESPSSPKNGNSRRTRKRSTRSQGRKRKRNLQPITFFGFVQDWAENHA